MRRWMNSSYFIDLVQGLHLGGSLTNSTASVYIFDFSTSGESCLDLVILIMYHYIYYIVIRKFGSLNSGNQPVIMLFFLLRKKLQPYMRFQILMMNMQKILLAEKMPELSIVIICKFFSLFLAS
jgi:hypothetical protein